MKKIKINKKQLIIYICIPILFIIILLIWAFFNGEKEVINNIQEIVPTEEISDEQLRNTTISLYYINKENGEIEAENKRIDSKKLLDNTYTEIMKMWFEGSNNKNLITGCSKNVKINKIDVIKNCAILDLSKEFINEKNKN